MKIGHLRNTRMIPVRKAGDAAPLDPTHKKKVGSLLRADEEEYADQEEDLGA